MDFYAHDISFLKPQESVTYLRDRAGYKENETERERERGFTKEEIVLLGPRGLVVVSKLKERRQVKSDARATAFQAFKIT